MERGAKRYVANEILIPPLRVVGCVLFIIGKQPQRPREPRAEPRIKRKKGRREPAFSEKILRSDADQYFATTGPPQLKR
jgi:hypothetical protein